jgi:hypothetical protein
VPFGDWKDVQKSDDFVVRINLETRNTATDDFAKDAVLMTHLIGEMKRIGTELDSQCLVNIRNTEVTFSFKIFAVVNSSTLLLKEITELEFPCEKAHCLKNQKN